MRWRPTLVVLHRDIGFLCLGLTLTYAISGIAVNHAHHWNYNRSQQVEQHTVGTPTEVLKDLPGARVAAIHADPANISRHEQNAIIAVIGEALNRKDMPRNVFWRGSERIRLFYGKDNSDTVDYNLSTGVLTHVVQKDRFLLRSLNFLHLNESRGWWTYLADVFAVLLIFLAVSGTVMVKGRRGFRGRGGVLALVGLVVPILGLVLLRHF